MYSSVVTILILLIFKLMKTKQEIIDEIVNLIKNNGITVEDIAKSLRKQKITDCFDLAISDGGCSVIRLPLSVAKDMNPLGIFPFKDSPIYLELDERDDWARTNAEADIRLRNVSFPTRDFCEKISRILPELNTVLKTLKSNPLEGRYYETSPYYLPYANWIVSFCEKDSSCGDDFYDYRERAKTRFVGWATK